MPRPRKPKQAPSETYAARVARGRVPVSVSLPAAALEQLDALARRRGETRGETIQAAVQMLADVARVQRGE